MARWHAIQAAVAQMELLARREWSVLSNANKVENIELFRRHRTATSNQRRVQADNVTSRMFVYIQTNMEEKVIVAVCGHRPELTGPRTGLQSAWGTAGTGRHPDGAPGGDSEIPSAPCVSRGLHEPRHDGGWFSGVSGTCIAGTVHTGDISHDRRGKRAGWEIPVQKWAGKCVVFFSPWVWSATSANEVNSPKWSSGMIQASQVIVFASVAFGLNAPLQFNSMF